MRVRQLSLPLLLSFAACGDGTTTPPAACDAPAASVVGSLNPAIAEPRPAAAAGSGTLDLPGHQPPRLTVRATAYELSLLAAVTIIDAFVVDASGRPSAELLVVLTSRALPQTVPLLPVTLAQLRDPTFRPDGPFAVFAEGYDPATNDYGRWLVETEGCVIVSEVSSGQVARMSLQLSLAGAWQTRDGASLGTGRISGVVEAPLLRLRSPSGSIADTLEGAVVRGPTAPTPSSDLHAYQVLAADQTRLTVVARVSGNPPSEIWLSLNGVPQAGDSIPLRQPTIAEALAGRASESFGMVRVLEPAGGAIRELWRSTFGFVKLTNVVQNGPLALCGWATGIYEFVATGIDTRDPAHRPLEGNLTASGRFETRFTIVSPGDTLVGSASGVPRPQRTQPCPF